MAAKAERLTGATIPARAVSSRVRLGIAAPSFWPPQAVPVPRTHSAGAFTLSKVAVETGKISLCHGIANSHADRTRQLHDIVPGFLPDAVAAGEGERNVKRWAHQHDRIGELKRAGIDGLGRDQPKRDPVADEDAAPRVVRFGKADDFEPGRCIRADCGSHEGHRRRCPVEERPRVLAAQRHEFRRGKIGDDPVEAETEQIGTLHAVEARLPAPHPLRRDRGK